MFSNIISNQFSYYYSYLKLNPNGNRSCRNTIWNIPALASISQFKIQNMLRHVTL